MAQIMYPESFESGFSYDAIPRVAIMLLRFLCGRLIYSSPGA
jgi:hypothetical protein